MLAEEPTQDHSRLSGGGSCSEEPLKMGAGEAPRKQHQVKSSTSMGKEAERPRFTLQS